jgi:hypothetical protein
MGDRIALAGMRCPSRGKEESRDETGGLSPAARKTAQAVMRIATADPLSDSQREQVVRLALGKRVPATNGTERVVAAHVAAAAAGGGDSSRAPAAAAELIGDHQAEQRVESGDESESRASDPTGTGESPPPVSRAQSTSPEPREAAAPAPPKASTAQTEGASQPTEAAVTTQGRKKKNKAARRAAR